MRTSVPSALPLFRSETQVRLLSLLLLQPERKWTLSELSKTLQAPDSSIHRELGRIEGAGILRRDAHSRPHRFTAATDSPLFESLSELLKRTVSVEEDLKAALDVPGVLAAVIHGSWITGDRRPDSDIDVLVVGDVDLRGLRKRVRSVAASAGRRIDLTLFDREEFNDLVRQGRGFIKHLSDDATLPLIGDLDELIAI